MKKKMLTVLNSGGGISSTGDIFDVMEIGKSSTFVRKYRRKRESLHTIVNQIAIEEIEKAMEDEIEATLICEYGVEYYLRWKDLNGDERIPAKLCVGFDFGWKQAASRRLYNRKSGHGFLVGQYTK